MQCLDFQRRNGNLFAEHIAIADIAKTVGTPFYCYSATALIRRYQAFKHGLDRESALIAFAVKANSNVAVLKRLAHEGAGADIVSAGELHRALLAGIPAGKVVFSGVGKTNEEIAFALSAGIFQFNVESAEELDRINLVAADCSTSAPISLRVNPDIEAGGHSKISTGRAQDKFGIAQADIPSLAARASHMQHVDLLGLDVHIGSQITSPKPFKDAFSKLRGLADQLRRAGYPISRLDFGGGLGVGGTSRNALDIAEYCALVRAMTVDTDYHITVEPGRSIAAEAGILVSRVISTKKGAERTFLILDAGMNDLMRPALYDARHDIEPVTLASRAEEPVDIVGPVCETGDTFARQTKLQRLHAGELIAFANAGAYGAVLSNEYNSRPLIPEVLVEKGRWAIIRARPSYDEMSGRDLVPSWIGIEHEKAVVAPTLDATSLH